MIVIFYARLLVVDASYCVYEHGRARTFVYVCMCTQNIRMFLLYYIPTTSISIESTTVEKLGASADTSHVYLPVIFGVRLSSTTCRPFESVCYFFGEWKKKKTREKNQLNLDKNVDPIFFLLHSLLGDFHAEYRYCWRLDYIVIEHNKLIFN